jgi:hypothetical protein
MRASDAERDQAVGELREHFAAGRLSHDTFMYRMNTALGARNRSDLPPLLADLPGRQGPLGWLSGGWAGSLVHRVLGALSGQGRAGQGQPGQGQRGDGGVSVVPSPRRGLTTGFPAAPADPLVVGPAPGGRGMPAPIALPFPRGTQAMFTIGRDRGCDLAIDDLTVSRVHARLQRADGGWRLFDLGSTNGTRVNGWRVRGGVEVRAGDLVRFGDAEYALADTEF